MFEKKQYRERPVRDVKLLHMADIHLGMEPFKEKAGGAGLGRQLWDSFRETLKAAEREQVDLVLIAGDLFHRQPLKKELREVNAMFGELTRAKVVLMAGNHDYLSGNSGYRGFPWKENVYFFSSEEWESFTFPELSATVYGFSYEHRDIRESRYAKAIKNQDKGLHILLAHGGDEAHIPVRMGQLEELGMDYIALGHIHKPQQLKENRIVMAGALQPLEHNDTGPHGYWITELKKGEAYTSFHPIRNCEVVKLEIPLDETTTNHGLQTLVRQELSHLRPGQLAKILLTGAYDADMEPDTGALEELPQVVKTDKLCKPNYDFQKLKEEYRGQIVERYIREVQAMSPDEVTRRALYLGVDALLGNE